MNPCNSCEKELLKKLDTIERDTRKILSEERFHQEINAALFSAVGALLRHAFITTAFVVITAICFIFNTFITFLTR